MDFKIISLKRLSAIFLILLLAGCNLTVESTEGGLVRSSDNQINCGEQCSADYSETSTITLNAIADDDYIFDHWEGACEGSGDCTLVMGASSGNKKVNAVFRHIDDLVVSDYSIANQRFCSVLESRFLRCNDEIYSVDELGFDPLSAIEIGDNFVCVMETDGGIQCVGSEPGVVDNIPHIEAAQQISAAFAHVCVLEEQQVKCWGESISGVNTVPDLIAPTYVATSFNRACAIDQQTLICWSDTVEPYTIEGLVNPRSYSFGWSHGCAIDDTGVQCWGSNHYGQLDVPEGLESAREVVSGATHSCAIVENEVVCWGGNRVGQLDVPEGLVNPRNLKTYDDYTCVLSDGAVNANGPDGVVCWGVFPNTIIF